MAVVDGFTAKTIRGTSPVIQQIVSVIPSGATLDLSGWNEEIVKAGTLIVKDSTSGEYKPLGVTGSDYTAPDETAPLVGVLLYDISKTSPHGSILTAGQVNTALAPIKITKELAGKLPRIDFLFL